MTNLILNADSYKAAHYRLYPDNTKAQFSYIEARKPNKKIVHFGLSYAIKKYLLNPITTDMIDEAYDVLSKHGLPFNRDGWQYILEKHKGYLPLKIMAVPEGSVIDSQTPMVTIESTDLNIPWLPSYIETMLQRSVWYMSTIASNDLYNYKILKAVYDETSDNQTMLDFALHDFGARGVSSYETAEIGGLSHLLLFKGTDNLVALKLARDYFKCEMAGFSIPATEHSIQCAYGDLNQVEYLKKCIESYDLISIVLDGYNIFRETAHLCNHFKDYIIENNKKVVLRPDSGDPLEVIPQILSLLEESFGVTHNSKGFKVLNNVRIIQGDGIDTESMNNLCNMVKNLGFAAETVIYGSGGGLLQKVNRDTYSFAQKTSAMLIGDEWVDTVKKPITDPGKHSKGGRLTSHNMVEYFNNGKLMVDESFDEMRDRLFSQIGN